MLKRARVPSPSPTRPDPSSPPPLDNNPHLPITKRRRTAGPVIDSTQRRDPDPVDDGEDDYEDEDDEHSGTSVDVPQDKVYEHVNHFLHDLHAEYQHRSRGQPQPSFAASQYVHPIPQYHHGPAAFLSHREQPSALSSPASSPAKYTQHPQRYLSSSFSTQYREQTESQETEEGGPYGSDQFQDLDLDGAPDPWHKGLKLDMQHDERIRVTHRYEDTNRLLGSLVLGRRRTLGSPSIEPE